MKSYIALIFAFAFLAVASAQSAHTASQAGSRPVILAASADKPSGPKPADAMNEEYQDDETFNDTHDAFQEERVEIADPIEPFNRAMYQFNDKLYYWALKPAATGYKAVVPEPARISVKNFFFNLGFPIRFVNCLLQADFSGAGGEFGRFTINTLWGIGGLLDPSSDKEIGLVKQETDFGQTLGVYGVGHGFYMVWPVLGPSSPRDSVDIAGEYFLSPLSYVGPWYSGLGIRPFEMINSASLRIGEYESLQSAAIDPYVAMRDAYIQYRLKKIKARKARSLIFRTNEPGERAADLVK